MRTRDPAIVLALLLALLFPLAGCGQKGPLYLPDEPPAQENGDEEDDPSG